MSTSSNIRAGAAYVELFMEDNRLVRGLNNAKKKLETFGKSAGDIGKKMMGAGAFLGAPFLAGAKVFADFEEEMAKVSTALENPERYMDAFSKGIRNMSAYFGESTGKLAEGLYEILEASVPPQKALKVLGVAMKAAKASSSELGTTVEAITTVLNAYGLSADKAATVSDWLFAISKRGHSSFSELASSIGPIAGLAGSVGLSMNDLGAAIATMTKNGMKTEGALTTVQGLLFSFISPSKDAAECARSLGFEMSLATLKSEGLSGIFERLKNQPPETLARLFPAKALKGLLPLLSNLERFNGNLDAMKKRSGVTESAYAKMSQTLGTFFSRLKQAGLGVLNILGETLAKPIKKVIEITLRYLKIITEWIGNNRRLLITVAAVAGVIGGLGSLLFGLAIAAKTVAVIFSIVTGAFAAFGAIAGIIGSVIAVFSTTTGLVVIAVAALGGAILYYSGLGALALGWLGEKFRILKEFAVETWRGITDAMMGGNFQMAAEILWDSLKIAWLTGTNELKKYWVNFSAWYQRTTSEVFYGTLAIITDAWAGLKKSWTDTVSFLADIWNIFLNELRQAWNVSQAWLQKGWLSFMGLFDKKLNVEAAFELVDDELKMKNAESVGKLNKALTESSAKANKENAATEADRKSMQDLIAGNLSGDLAQIDSEAAQSIRKSQEALDKAKAEWQSAIAEAKSLNEKKKPGGGRIEDARQKLRSVPNLESVKGKVDVAGSFYAASVRSLSAGNASERTVKAVEETAKNTKKTNQLLEKQSSSDEMVFE